MRLVFSLLLCCAWSSVLQKQPPALGPWRVVCRVERVPKRTTFEGLVLSAADTTTVLQQQRTVEPASWDTPPHLVALLRNCENPLLAPPAQANSKLVAAGATLRFNSAHKRVWLVPTAPTVTLRAFRQHKQLLSHVFAVRPATHFTITCTYSNNPVIQWKHLRPASAKHMLSLQIIPSWEIAAILPADARYRVSQFRASLRRQRQTVKSVVVSGNRSDLNGWSPLSQPGDSLQVEVLVVERLNFQGRTEQLPANKRFAWLY